MVLDLALGRVVAGVGDGARVDAVVVDAGLLRRAVRVVGAVLGGAGDVGVAGQAGRAGAHRLVLHAAAHRVPAARPDDVEYRVTNVVGDTVFVDFSIMIS